MRQLRVLYLPVVGILVWALVFAGCSGSSTITITLTTTATSLNPGQTATVTATLTNDTNNQGVTWTLTGPGSLSGNTTTSVVYTAPTSIATSTTATITATSIANTTITTTQSISLTAVLTIATTSLPSATLGVAYDSFVNAAGAPAPFTWAITSGSLPAGLTFLTSSTSTSAEITGTPTVLETSNFSVQVTDSSDTSVTQALSITVNKPPPLSVATGSLQDGTVNVPYSQTLQASSGVPPYTWSLANSTLLPAGLSLNPSSGSITGTPIVTGTTNFTVQVTDSSTPTSQIATANLSITINPGLTNNGRLSGSYAFSVRGFDANGLFVAAGSFVADGLGNLASGIMDTNDPKASSLSQTFSGTYSIGQNGLGFMTLNTTPSRTFAVSMMVGGNANIIEFDDSNGSGTRNSGVLLKQTTTSSFSNSSVTGNYAFGFLGIDSSKNRFGMAGYFSADGNGNFTTGLLDSDDSSSGSSASVPLTGTYAVASTGRGTANIKTAQGTTGYSFYIVSSTELLVVETDTFATGGFPLVSGTALGQSSVNLTGPSVFEVTALDPTGSVAQSQVGIFTPSAGTNGGTYNLASDQNNGGTLTSPAGSGSYAIDPTSGRVSFLTGSSGFQNSQPVLYLVTDNQAFIIGTDSSVSFGFMTGQSSFTLSGTYAGGSLAPVDPVVSNVVSIAIAGSNTLNVTQDISSDNGLSESQFSAVTASSVGVPSRYVVTENGNPNPTQILYLVSTGEFFALDAASGDTTARLDIFQQ